MQSSHLIALAPLSHLLAAASSAVIVESGTTYGKSGYVGKEDIYLPPLTLTLSMLQTKWSMNSQKDQDQDQDAGDGDREAIHNTDNYLTYVANNRLSVILILATLLSGITLTLLVSALPPKPNIAFKAALLAVVKMQPDSPAILGSHTTVFADVLWFLGLISSFSLVLLSVFMRWTARDKRYCYILLGLRARPYILQYGYSTRYLPAL
ncbi:hypothetical protein BDP27DRAFT_1369186 [Rhodocollybia butyracea]|uniref:Uncharacterized protein n=1 Tax=Rhodocollybia butyracea TaxID=206335 RepID=A0A9P5PEP4_9AGAR|nr:hypothetical protein BDP27DRAFT_1369186 [Rhodocollybia butyracea]